MRKWYLAVVAAISGALMVGGPAMADPRGDGLAAFVRGDFVTARQILLPFANSGDKDAETALGDIYYDGLGVPKDYATGVVWFHKAADQGVPVAQFFLGVSYTMGRGSSQDLLQAWVWFTLAAPRFTAGDANLRDQAIKLAGAAALRLSPAQIAEGQRMVLAWARKTETAGETAVAADDKPTLEASGASPPKTSSLVSVKTQVSGAPNEQSSSGGAWAVEETTSPLDQTKNYSVSVSSNESLDNILGRQEKAQLFFSCDRKGFFATIVWPDFIEKEDVEDSTVLISWKLDDDPVEKSSWFASTIGVAAPGGQGMSLLKAWAGGKVLIVRVPDKHGGQDATFNIDGIAAIFSALSQRNCG
jgi:uncharacterized protein